MTLPAAVHHKARNPLLLLGVGLGGFADGILFHQVLQWHHLVAGYRSPDDLEGLQVNTLADGVFHVLCWIAVAAGVLWVARAYDDVRTLGLRGATGWLLVGWGAWHLVDEVLFHVVLQAHHIRMVEDYLVYDLAYTASGVLLLLAGVALLRRA